MRIHKFACSFFALALFISCSDENSPNNASEDVSAINGMEMPLTEQETKVLLRMRDPNNRVSIEEVTKLTYEFIGSFEDEKSLKSGTTRKISSVSALVSGSKPALKSVDIEIPDTLAYVLNFNDSSGYVIASADTRIDYPILVFVENGSLADSTDNPGMTIFLDKLEDYMLNSIAEAEHQKDSLLDDILAKLSIETDTKSIYSVTPIDDLLKVKGVQLLNILLDTTWFYKTDPLMKVEWGQQRDPYNSRLPDAGCLTTENRRYPAGCVATALAQMMSYWKYPTHFDWKKINDYTAYPNRYIGVGSKDIKYAPSDVKDTLAALFQAIDINIRMKYACSGSSATMPDALSFLRALGFTASPLTDYNSNYVMAYIVNMKWPIIASGCSSLACHAWVMDGHIRRKVKYVVAINGIVQPPIDSYFDYVHNNWGWDSSDNGYFANGIFDAKDHDSNFFAPSTKSSQPYDFQSNVKMVVIYR